MKKVSRSVSVNIKLSQEEHEAFNKTAIAEFLPLASWIRQAAGHAHAEFQGKRYRNQPMTGKGNATVIPPAPKSAYNMQPSPDAFIAKASKVDPLFSGAVSKPKKIAAPVLGKIECPFCYDKFMQVTATQVFCCVNCEEQFNAEGEGMAK